MERESISAKALDKLLAEAALRTPLCEQCTLGEVLAIPVDERMGCNWKLSRIQGSHCVECLEALQDIIDDFRARFRLETPPDAPTAMTPSWATR